ncbi:MAG: potassium transporter Kup [Acidimicrobiia bacterium]
MTETLDTNERRRPKYLLLTSIGALGIVFGDIGTSPLYAMRESFLVAGDLAVSRDAVLGILSLILWSLVFVVSIKYLLIVMRADNEGEGGIMALTALILRGSIKGRSRVILVTVGLFGTALLYGDGVITPAISVLAAVEGVEVALPSLEPYAVFIASAILIALFMVQRKGTSVIGAFFGPVMLVWFGVLALLGIGQIFNEPSVIAAVNPLLGLEFLFDNPGTGFLALGGVFLVVTGSEALYADMGHFGKSPIRIGWFTLVFPALLLNYFGQGSLLLSDPSAIDNPFFRMAPSWAGFPLVILATMATVIASQALISGAFSLTMQAIQLGYLPRQNIDHTSPREFGQVYLPTVNWVLMVATIVLVFAFQTTTNLAAAYGVAVTTTMVITTALIYVVMRRTWGWSPARSIVVTVIFLIVDLAFFGANIVKLPDGGWVPLLIGGFVFTLMATWKYGRTRVKRAMNRAELPIERFIGSITEHPQVRVPGTAVYLFPEVGATPPTLLANLRHNEVLHETVALVSVQVARRPKVLPARRATVHPLGEEFYQIVLRYGFVEEPDVPRALAEIIHQDFGFDDDTATYFLGRETIIPGPGRGPSSWRDHLYSLLQRNASSAAQFFRLPPEDVVEIGKQIEI